MTLEKHAESDHESVEAVVGGLVRAWNKGDARTFASYFADDADLVNIHGMHIRGRQAIAGVYDMLFRSVFASSTTKASISSLRLLRKTVALVHLKVELKIHVAPHAGTNYAVTSVVMLRDGFHWKVTALHNTLVTGPGDLPMTRFPGRPPKLSV